MSRQVRLLCRLVSRRPQLKTAAHWRTRGIVTALRRIPGASDDRFLDQLHHEHLDQLHHDQKLSLACCL